MVTANYPISTSAVYLKFAAAAWRPSWGQGYITTYGAMRRRGPPPGSLRISVVSCGVQYITLAHEDRGSSIESSSQQPPPDIEQLSVASLPYLKVVEAGQQDRCHDLSQVRPLDSELYWSDCAGVSMIASKTHRATPRPASTSLPWMHADVYS